MFSWFLGPCLREGDRPFPGHAGEWAGGAGGEEGVGPRDLTAFLKLRVLWGATLAS